MQGIVISKIIKHSNNIIANTPVVMTPMYSCGSVVQFPNSHNSKLMICKVDADADEFQVMGLNKDITVLWYEAAEWTLESLLAPEFVAQYHQYGVQLEIPQGWLDVHVVVGRITQDVINSLIQYLEETT